MPFVLLQAWPACACCGSATTRWRCRSCTAWTSWPASPSASACCWTASATGALSTRRPLSERRCASMGMAVHTGQPCSSRTMGVDWRDRERERSWSERKHGEAVHTRQPCSFRTMGVEWRDREKAVLIRARHAHMQSVKGVAGSWLVQVNRGAEAGSACRAMPRLRAGGSWSAL